MKSEGTSSQNTRLSKNDAALFLNDLAEAMLRQELIFESTLKQVSPQFQISAKNLLHYLQLRSEDIRALQQFLHCHGLSSLTSSESHTLSQLLQVLYWITPKPELKNIDIAKLCDFDTALMLRQKHMTNLLGTARNKNLPHIMVTFSEALGEDLEKIEKLLKEGMTVARINCAHDDPVIWLKIIDNIHEVSERINTRCKVYMDLAGPKIRVSEVPYSKTKTEGLQLDEGDTLVLTEIKNAARGAKRKRDGSLKSPARIVIQPAGLISMMKVGDRVYFDDGKFKSEIIEIKKNKATAKVVRISTRHPVLRASKGVNLPDAELTISSLTEADLLHLPFIAKHADIIGYSFVSNAQDLKALRDHIRFIQDNVPPIILKIERLSAIQNLPELLLEGMKDKSFGVMIARGDLAVEIGFERLSEIQQEILWICEAAHVPVVWATQVLENLNKTGFATRSEITDAAMGGMAECVMLNKGKHVVKAVHMLVDILTRITSHTDKKRFTFRPLSIAKNFLDAKGASYVVDF